MSNQNFIILSNSVPKSGSSFLYNNQIAFLESFGQSYQKDTVDKMLRAAGVDSRGGFVKNPLQKEFLTFLSNFNFETSLVIKLHTSVNNPLRDIICGSGEKIVMSFIHRDPRDILLSAKDNFEKTGEFEKFATLDQGVNRLKTYFTALVDSLGLLSGRNELRVVRYVDLLTSPVETTLASIPHARTDEQMVQRLSEELNKGASRERSAHRLNTGKLSRFNEEFSESEKVEISSELAPLIQKLGYTV